MPLFLHYSSGRQPENRICGQRGILVIMPGLDGRVALVTGASRGIGRSIAIALAEAGADIVLNYRVRENEVRATEAAILGLGRSCTVVRADVSRHPEVDTMVELSLARHGHLDILVNNAGIARRQSVEESTLKEWNEIIAVNLTSCFLVTQAVLPGMRERRWGRIINLSSVAAHVGGIVAPQYAASKAGMLGLTHFYANALVKEGITVNAISPALIETEMVTSNLAATSTRIPVGRFGTVDEVAGVALMLAGNAYITGQTIHVNGGWYMT
jgi:3-oxoacyl-[acyl-carrier protein] reductase